MSNSKPRRGRPPLPPGQALQFRTVSCRLETGLADAFEAWCIDKNTTPHRELSDFIRKRLGR
jgi:hypothetical protein